MNLETYNEIVNEIKTAMETKVITHVILDQKTYTSLFRQLETIEVDSKQIKIVVIPTSKKFIVPTRELGT